MASLGNLFFKVVTEENLNKSNEVTDRPVEEGTDIIDHIDHKPARFDLTVLITGDDAQDRYNSLLEMADADEVYDYYPEQRYDPFKNMAIETVSIPKDSKIANGYQVKLSIKQVRIVEQQAAFVTIGKDPSTGKQPGTKSTKTDFNQPKAESVDQNSVSSSMLYKMTHGTG